MIQLCVYIHGSQLLETHTREDRRSNTLPKSHSQTHHSAWACSVPMCGIQDPGIHLYPVYIKGTNMNPGHFWHPRYGRICKCHQSLWQAAPVPSDRGTLVIFLHTPVSQADGKAVSITKCHRSPCLSGKCILSPGEHQLQHPSSGCHLVLPVLAGGRD